MWRAKPFGSGLVVSPLAVTDIIKTYALNIDLFLL